MTIKEIQQVNNRLCDFKQSPLWNDTIHYLNEMNIDYATESGRDTKWTDLEIYMFYLEHKNEVDNFDNTQTRDYKDNCEGCKKCGGITCGNDIENCSCFEE